MAGGRGSDRKTRAWCFIALLLSERAIAIRLATAELERAEEEAVEEVSGLQAADAVDSTRENMDSIVVQGGIGPKEQKAFDDFAKAYEKGKEAEEKLTCEKIQERMVTAIQRARGDLHRSCEGELCDFSDLDLDEIIIGQEMVTAYAAAADKRKCLPQVMGSEEVQAELADFLSIVPKVLHSSDRREGRARLQEAFVQIVSFQQGTLLLEDALADRRLFMKLDMKEQCPSPCGMCDHKKSGHFAFRCLLRKGDKDSEVDLPASHGVTCAAPKRRGFFSAFRRYPYEKQCEVADWKELALQQVHVSSMLSCATSVILMGLNGELTEARRHDMHMLCVKVEQGNGVSEEEQRQYTMQMKRIDDVVSKGLKLTFGVFVIFGLASGLAALRLASHGNQRRDASLIGGALAANLPQEFGPEDFFTAFVQHLAGQGLRVRQMDREMYGNPELVRNDEVLHRLTACEDVYSLKAHNTFAEASKSLLAFSVSIRQGDAKMQDFITGAVTGMIYSVFVALSWVSMVAISFAACFAAFSAAILLVVVPIYFLTSFLARFLYGNLPIRMDTCEREFGQRKLLTQ